MALIKESVISKIEVTENGCVQVRVSVRIVEDGVKLSESYHRHTIVPGDDFVSEDSVVQAVCSAVHTKEVIDAHVSGN